MLDLWSLRFYNVLKSLFFEISHFIRKWTTHHAEELLTLCCSWHGPLTFLFWYLKTRKDKTEIVCKRHVEAILTIVTKRVAVFQSGLTSWTGRIIWKKSHPVTMQPARWGHQGWYRLPGPPLHWSLVQLMDICHSPTTADPATLRAAMKYVWNKDV